ncbi:hypothetical protein Tco_0551841 [Tanacetum coccineum]
MKPRLGGVTDWESRAKVYKEPGDLDKLLLVQNNGPLCCYRCSLEEHGNNTSIIIILVSYCSCYCPARDSSTVNDSYPTQGGYFFVDLARNSIEHASPRSSDHCSSSSSSSSDSSPVHSLGLDASDQAYSGSSTRDVSSQIVRFISSKASIEEDTEIDPIETEVDMELGISDGDDVQITVKDGTIVRSFKDMPIDLDDDVRDFYHHMSEVHIDRIVGIETAQRRL